MTIMVLLNPFRFEEVTLLEIILIMSLVVESINLDKKEVFFNEDATGKILSDMFRKLILLYPSYNVSSSMRARKYERLLESLPKLY